MNNPNDMLPVIFSFSLWEGLDRAMSESDEIASENGLIEKPGADVSASMELKAFAFDFVNPKYHGVLESAFRAHMANKK